MTPDPAWTYASYSISRFRVPNGETVTGYTLTFPSDTDASNPTTNPGDSVVAAGDWRTVTVTYGQPIVGPANGVILTLGNIRNPSAPGTYAIPQVTFHLPSGDQTVNLSAATYTITPAPYLSMTITTPDPGQTVDFGAIDPGVTTPQAKSVTISVTSSAAYTLTRAIGGNPLMLGLAVSTPTSRVGSPGSTAFTDEFTLTPPWTTDPGVPLTATITYTVTQ